MSDRPWTGGDIVHHRGARINTSEFEDSLDYGDRDEEARNEAGQAVAQSHVTVDVDTILSRMSAMKQEGSSTVPPIEAADAEKQQEPFVDERGEEIYKALLPEVKQVMMTKRRRQDTERVTRSIVEDWETLSDEKKADIYKRVVKDSGEWRNWRKHEYIGRCKFFMNEENAARKREEEAERKRKEQEDKRKDEAARKRKEQEEEAERERKEQEDKRKERKREEEEQDAARKRQRQEDKRLQKKGDVAQKMRLVLEDVACAEGYTVNKDAAKLFIKNSELFSRHNVLITKLALKGEKKIQRADVEIWRDLLSAGTFSEQKHDGIMYHYSPFATEAAEDEQAMDATTSSEAGPSAP